MLPLWSAWPSLARHVEPVSLGVFPTPVERLEVLERELSLTAPLFVKRDDLSSPLYGGNKVRTLEILFALARARGARQIVATGAFGSNHAVATVLHAPRAGLEPGAILFPQPGSFAALENLRVTAARARFFRAPRHWAWFPFAWLGARAKEREIMVPGGATPEGALGYVSAGLELAQQVKRGELEAPRFVCVGVGSTCTSAGLLVGLALAHRLGIGFVKPPLLVAVRVTPWPVTSRTRILRLAERTSLKLAELATEPSLRLTASDLSPHLLIDGHELGPGYGIASRVGLDAIELFERLHLFALDTTYSSKAAAGFLRVARREPEGPVLFWSTKSTAPLPEIRAEELTRVPSNVKRWMARAAATASARHF